MVYTGTWERLDTIVLPSAPPEDNEERNLGSRTLEWTWWMFQDYIHMYRAYRTGVCHLCDNQRIKELILRHTSDNASDKKITHTYKHRILSP